MTWGVYTWDMDTPLNPAGKGKKLLISIHLGIASAFVALVLISCLALSSVLFFQLKQNFRDELRKQVQSVVAVGVSAIDWKAHQALQPGDEEAAAYLKIKKWLQAVRDGGVDIKYVYTMRLGVTGKPEFVVDAETDPAEMSMIGDEYADATPSLLKAFEAGAGVQVEQDLSSDQWGTWLSGFAPILDEAGTVTGILGVDVSAQRILDDEGAVYRSLLGISLTVSMVILVFAWFVSRRITRPLGLIEKDMIRIQRFDIDGVLNIKSLFREIQSIISVVGDMKNSLRSFKKYVPSDLVAQLITEHQQADLGGERRDITVFFSDIENFTTWSEMLSPEELIKIMARYFAGMTETILGYHGTVDKYIGDAIMAFWGAPTRLEDHAVLAAQAALECQKFQQKFNLELESEGRVSISTRIGLNSGEALVGNVGYEARLNYTALGDHVNLASRLEGLNKYYGTNIIISHYTWDRICHAFVARKIDCVVVKGRRRYIYVYELLSGIPGEPGIVECAKLTDKACGLYFQRNWKEARVIYQDLLTKNPADRPSQIMAQRCSQYIEQDPGPDWEGVLILRDK